MANNNNNNNNNNNDIKNNNKSVLGDLKTSIENYLVKARNKILNILVNEYKFDKESAYRAEDSIHTSTRSAMREMYTYKDNFSFLERLVKTNKQYSTTINDYPDFANWSWTALTIPFYQSLGDTIGYYNGNWEFNYGDVKAGPDYVNELIYEFISLGGINDISITNWMSSDDTILYIATMEVLSDAPRDINDFGQKLRDAYLKSKPLIENRNPGQTTMDSLEQQQTIDWDKLPYNGRAIGNGSAMRSGCIGIFFPGKINRKKLIALSVECSRITHNSAVAILGSLVNALFTAYALEKVPINLWPHKLLKLLRSDKIDQYMKHSRPKEYPLYSKDKIIFIGQWDNYVTSRFSGINPKLDLKFMKNAVLRYKYLSENFSKGCDIPGSCADDCVIMAYDALLQSEGIFEKVVVYSILHPGDSDTVGSIALSWYGAFYHSLRNETLIGSKFRELEFYDKLYDLLEKNIMGMTKVYYYDIYLNAADKYLKQIIAK